MSALEFLNMGLQTLLPGLVGCLLVCLVLKDARHRAWAALITVAAMVVLPWFPLWYQSDVSMDTTGFSSWRPEWKVKVSEPVPMLTVSQGALTAAESAVWNLPHWSSATVWIWGAVGGVMLLMHLWQTLTIHWWIRKLPLHEKGGERVRVAEGLGSPCLVGVFKPEIVVPEQALGEWSERQWLWTLAHEREHLRGGDALVAWILGWVKAALWWNPLMHRLIGEWEQAREEICDRAAAAKADDAAPYSEFLLSVAVAARSPGVAMAVSRPARRLKARLMSLLEHRPVRRWPHWTFLVLVVVVSALWVNLVGCVSLEQQGKLVDEGPLMTRSFKVAPDFLSVFQERKTGGSGLGPRVSAHQGLMSYGVDFPEGASATFNAATSQLIVKNTARRLGQVEALLSALKARNEVHQNQIHISSKWVEMPSDTPVVEDLSVMTDPQFAVLLRSFSQMKGLDLMMAPSVTTRNGQRAIIEVAHEMKTLPTGMDFSGVRHELVPIIHEGKIQISLVADMGVAFRGGKRLFRKYEESDDQVTIKHLIRRETMAVFDGETLAIHMGEPMKGRKVVLFLTPIRIDPSGRKIDMKEATSLKAKGSRLPEPKTKAENQASPEKRVRLNATLFEVEGDFLPDLKSTGSDTNASPDSVQIAPGVLAVSGVLTPEQFRKTQAQWKAHPRTTVSEALVIAKPDAESRMKLGDGSEVAIRPALGADGYTIDLEITPRLTSRGQPRQMTTSITIWDQQTVFLGGVMETGADGKPAKSLILAITAQIVK